MMAKEARTCADCGTVHHPQAPLNRANPDSQAIAFANPMIGVILCPEYISIHSIVNLAEIADVQNVTMKFYHRL